MANKPIATNSTNLGIRNRSRLPAGQSLMISVTWLRMPGVLMFCSVLALVSFVLGIFAGTGGWYRETVESLTGSSEDQSAITSFLLSPDMSIADQPTMRQRLTLIEDRLGQLESQQTRAFSDYQSISADYGRFVVTLGAFREAILTLSQSTNAATETSDATRAQLDLLIASVLEAQRNRAEAIMPDPSKNATETKEAKDESQ